VRGVRISLSMAARTGRLRQEGGWKGEREEDRNGDRKGERQEGET
jgi:hypothetical protein